MAAETTGIPLPRILATQERGGGSMGLKTEKAEGCSSVNKSGHRFFRSERRRGIGHEASVVEKNMGVERQGVGGGFELLGGAKSPGVEGLP